MNLYLILVGEPGCGKSRVIVKVKQILEEEGFEEIKHEEQGYSQWLRATRKLKRRNK